MLKKGETSARIARLVVQVSQICFKELNELRRVDGACDGERLLDVSDCKRILMQRLVGNRNGVEGLGNEGLIVGKVLK